MKSTAKFCFSLVVIIGMIACAQKTVKPLTNDERLLLRNDQKAFQDQQQELFKTPQYIALSALQAKLNKDVDDVFKSRSITTIDYSLCDGPAEKIKACDGLAPAQIELRQNPKPPEPAKK